MCSSFFVHDVGDAFSERLRPHSADRTWAAQWVRSMIPGTCDDVERASMVLRPLFAESSRRTSGRHVVPNGEALGRSRSVRSLQPDAPKVPDPDGGAAMMRRARKLPSPVASPTLTNQRPHLSRLLGDAIGVASPTGSVEASASPPLLGIP